MSAPSLSDLADRLRRITESASSIGRGLAANEKALAKFRHTAEELARTLRERREGE